MANEEHLAQLKKGVEAWNEWRRAKPNVRPNLRRADLSGAVLTRAVLGEADLSLAKLGGVNLSSADLRRADLSSVDLSEANLSGADLSLAKLGKADLSEANLSKADFRGADLSGAVLSKADFSGAVLSEANLSWADLSGAVLSEADLNSANLSEANLDAADLSRARMSRAVFAGNDLSTTKGLDLVEHWARSTIGIDTIYMSHGKIPLAFLRGCGVPEGFIEYMPSLVAEGAIQFYSCFISYSMKDQEFAERLYGDLQNKGVRCWFAPHDVKGGEFLDEQIDAAIRLHEKVCC